MRLMYGLEWRTVYALTRGLFGCIKRQDKSAHKRLVMTEHTITLFRTWHDDPINGDFHTVPFLVCLCSISSDDVTIDCATLVMMSLLIVPHILCVTNIYTLMVCSYLHGFSISLHKIHWKHQMFELFDKIWCYLPTSNNWYAGKGPLLLEENS